MDLNSVKISETFDVHITHPLTEEETDIVIKIQSYAGERAKTVKRKIANRRMKVARNKRLTADDIEEESIEVACSVWVGWENMELDGKPLEFNLTNVKKIVSDPAYTWLVKQVDKAASEELNFMSA